MIRPQGKRQSSLNELCFGFIYLLVSEHLICCEDAFLNLSVVARGRRESRQLRNAVILGFEISNKWHLGIVGRCAVKHEWVIGYYTVFSLPCSYLGFQMLMMMRLKNIMQIWKKRNQKRITNKWVSVSSNVQRSCRIGNPVAPGGVR